MGNLSTFSTYFYMGNISTWGINHLSSVGLMGGDMMTLVRVFPGKLIPDTLDQKEITKYKNTAMPHFYT